MRSRAESPGAPRASRVFGDGPLLVVARAKGEAIESDGGEGPLQRRFARR